MSTNVPAITPLHLHRCFCPRTFVEDIGLDLLPWYFLVWGLYSPEGYSVGVFQVLWLVDLALFRVVYQPLAHVRCSTFSKSYVIMSWSLSFILWKIAFLCHSYTYICIYHSSIYLYITTVKAFRETISKDDLARGTCTVNGSNIHGCLPENTWRHQMETFSALLAICAGNSPVTGEFPAQRTVTRSFGVFFDLRLNKWLSKQSWGCTDLRRYHAHYDVTVMQLSDMRVNDSVLNTVGFVISVVLTNVLFWNIYLFIILYAWNTYAFYCFFCTSKFTWFDMVFFNLARKWFGYEHDDVIKWKHFPRNWSFVREIHRSPVNFPHKGQWRGALMFSLIYAWINDWVNNREAGDLRRKHGHYDVIVMGHGGIYMSYYRDYDRFVR